MKKFWGTTSLAIALGAFAVWAILRIHNFDGPHALVWRVPLDLHIYVLAGLDIVDGGLLYDQAYVGELPFTYPPFAGVVFTALSYLSDNWLIILWQGGTALALFLVFLLVFRERGYGFRPSNWLISALLTLAAVATEPVHGTLFFGQINVFLMLLVALDFLPKWRLPGIGIGLAAGLKLTPAFLGLVLLFQRRWWAAGISIVTFLATVGVGYWLIPDAHDFWMRAIFDSSRVGDHENPGAQSIRSVLEREFSIEGGIWWIAAVLVVFVLTCIAVYVAARRHNATVAMALTGISSCLVSPFSWYHHWVWILPLFLAILLSVNNWIGQRLHGWFGAQVAGLASLLVMFIAASPFVTHIVWNAMSYRYLDDVNSFGAMVFIGTGVLFIASYALSGLLPSRASSSTSGK